MPLWLLFSHLNLSTRSIILLIMAPKKTHLLAAEADGLNKELAEIAIKVIDLPHKMPSEVGLTCSQKEIVEICSWLEPESLEKRIRNLIYGGGCLTSFNKDITRNEIRIHILHHVLLDIIAYYAIPYKTRLWYVLWPQFKYIAEKEGFNGIYKLADKSYQARISYGPYGEIHLSRTSERDLDYIKIIEEILNVCQTWFRYYYRHTCTPEELKYELRKCGIWAGHRLCERYGFDVNLFDQFFAR